MLLCAIYKFFPCINLMIFSAISLEKEKIIT